MSSKQVIFGKPEREGYLKKQGGRFKNYKKRWFELKDGCLYYYKNPNEKPTGIIRLQGCNVEDAEGDTKKRYSFKITGPFPRVWYIFAETEADFRGWVDAIQSTIDKLPKGGKAGDAGSSQMVKGDGDGIIVDEEEGGGHVGLSDFELLKVIGRGSFGKVMLVRKKGESQLFAMKVLRKDLLIQENMVGHTNAEKTILANIKHPFLVSLHYAFQSPEKLYLVLTYLSGGELFFHLKQEGRFNENRARLYAAEILLALEHLHKHDIVYRDLKPENVVLADDGHLCITDFGLAKQHISAQKATFTFCGTPEYLAPEVLTGEGHGKPVDWWSLGVLLYEMLTGLPPFYSENVNHMYDLILRAPLTFPRYVSEDAKSILSQLLERDPKNRLGSGSDDGAPIKRHPFFKSLNWDDVYNKRLTPEFIPEKKAAEDAQYFDEEFTREAARDTVVQSTERTANNAEAFADFSYTAPSAMKKTIE